MKSQSWVAIMSCLFLACACAGRSSHPASAAIGGSSSFDIHLKQGISFLDQGDYGGAVGELRAAVEINPDSPKAHNYLGLCYFLQKSYDPAREQFEKAVVLDPSFATAHNNLAGVYSVKSEYAKAEEHYRKALSLSPDMISANYSLGTLLLNLGQSEAGMPYLSRGISLDPDFLEKHKELVITFSSLTFNRKDTYFAFAKVYASSGNIEKTLEYLEKAREAGFVDWQRILRDKEFEKVRDEPRVMNYLKSQAS
jgi:tetratricopeptide (TPR) repeat protein